MTQSPSRPRQLALGFLDEGLSPGAPTAAMLARRFHARQAEAVLRLLRPQGRGRLRQLAVVCPGALSVAASAHAWAAWSRRCTGPFLDGVTRGRPLGTLLTALLESLQSEREDPQLAERLPRQRLLLKRATAGVHTERILLWVPAVLVPEDIPVTPRENERWFTTLVHPCLDLERESEPGVPEVCRFLSRHVRAWWAMACPPSCAELVGYAAHTRHLPTRTSHPTRWLADAQRWLEATPHGEWHDRLVLGDEPALAGLPGGRGPGWWVRPLCTVGELVEEGRVQRNCLKDVEADCLQPSPVRDSFYAAQVAGERLTVGLSLAGTWVRLGQVRRAANQPPSATARAVVTAWLEEQARAAGLQIDDAD